MSVEQANAGIMVPADVLGVGFNRGAVYDRRGEQRLLDLPSASRVGWSRVLNDISTATITAPVPSSGAAREACCGEFGKVHTWRHSLVIHRNSERVWEGPIVKVVQRRNEMELTAWDVLGWTRKRRINANRVIASSPVVTEADLCLQRAYTADDPNVLGWRQNPVGPAATGRAIARESLLDSAYYWDDISAMCDMGLCITTVGRRILLWPSSGVIGRTALLLPDNHLLADVEVIEDGELLATAASARDDAGHSAYVAGAQGAVDPYYGLVESIVSSGGGTSTTAALTQQATAYYRGAYPAPVVLSIPDGATLRSDAPFPISTLVAGTTVPVQSHATCTDVDATFILQSLSVQQAGTGGEEVGITLQPVSLEVTS